MMQKRNLDNRQIMVSLPMLLSRRDMTYVDLFVVSPALTAIGLNKMLVPRSLFPGIAFAGIVVMYLHVSRALKDDGGKGVVQWARAIVFGPLMFYLGIAGRSPTPVASAMAALATPFEVLFEMAEGETNRTTV
jgi:hypothetical protein